MSFSGGCFIWNRIRNRRWPQADFLDRWCEKGGFVFDLDGARGPGFVDGGGFEIDVFVGGCDFAGGLLGSM